MPVAPLKGSYLGRPQGDNICPLPQQAEYPHLCAAASTAADLFIPSPQEMPMPLGFTCVGSAVTTATRNPFRWLVQKTGQAWNRQIDQWIVKAFTKPHHWFFKRYVEDISRPTLERALRLLESMAPQWSDMNKVRYILDGLRRIAVTQEARYSCTTATRPLAQFFGRLQERLAAMGNGYKLPLLRAQFDTPWAALRDTLKSFPE